MARKRTQADCVGQLDFETISQAVELDFAIESMARCLLPHLRQFYEDPQNRGDFEAWQKKRQEKS